MNRPIAIRRLQRIIDRLNENSGIIETPLCSYPAVQVRQAWLFGSLLKGDDAPRNVDILLEWYRVGEHRTWQQIGSFDPSQYRRHGVQVARCPEAAFKKALKQHIPLISLHDFEVDGGLAYPRVEIWPNNHFVPD